MITHDRDHYSFLLCDRQFFDGCTLVWPTDRRGDRCLPDISSDHGIAARHLRHSGVSTRTVPSLQAPAAILHRRTERYVVADGSGQIEPNFEFSWSTSRGPLHLVGCIGWHSRRFSLVDVAHSYCVASNSLTLKRHKAIHFLHDMKNNGPHLPGGDLSMKYRNIWREAHSDVPYIFTHFLLNSVIFVEAV